MRLRAFRLLFAWLLFFSSASLSLAADQGPINSGETRAGAIGSAAATDSWTFEGTAGNRVIINTITTSGNLAATATLYPPGGPAEVGSGANTSLDYQLQHTGTYTIIVQDFSKINTGNYNITFLIIPGAVVGAGDPDGGPIDSGQTLHGTISVASDMDAFQFYGEAGNRVIINTIATSGTLSTITTLYPPGGGAYESRAGAEGPIDYQLKNTGVYTIVVEDFAYFRTGDYYLTLLKIPGSVSSQADPDGGPIASGQTIQAAINAPSDIDAYQFYGEAGNRVIINTIATSGTLSTVTNLYPPGGGPSEVVAGADAAIDYQLKNSGLYTIVVKDFARFRTGDYGIALIKIPGPATCPTDRDGGFINSGQTLQAAIDKAADLDAFQFYGDAGQRVVINTTATSGNMSPVTTLYPPGGGPSEAAAGAGSHIDQQLSNSGLYTLVVRDFARFRTGNFNISLDKIPSTATLGIYNPSPANGATVYQTKGAFSWAAVSGATGYDLYFGEGVTQALPKIGNNLPSPSMPFSGLIRGKIYYWQVVAHNAQGDIQGPYCWFQVSTRPPGSPGLLLLLE